MKLTRACYLELSPPRSSAATWLSVGGCIFCAFGTVALGQNGLRDITEIRSMPREEAARQLPVRVRGVVTLSWEGDAMTVQDDSAGIWVSAREAKVAGIWKGDESSLAQLREGDEVEISGVTHEGGYAPVVLPEEIRKLGTRPMPTPAPLVPARLFTGAEDCQWLELRGVLQSYQEMDSLFVFQLDTNPGTVSVEVEKDFIHAPLSLIDSVVSLRGVVTTLFNTRSEFSGVRLLVGRNEDFKVEKAQPAFQNVPKVSLANLLPFRSEPLGPHRVRVEGTVTNALQGQFFYLQEGSNAVRVETASKVHLKPGDRVEAVGFVKLPRPIGAMYEATFRKLGTTAVPLALDMQPEMILEINQRAMIEGRSAKPHDYDGHLIRCTGRLISSQSENGGATQTLSFERQDSAGHRRIFRAQLHHGAAAAFESLQLGSEIELTGLVQLEFPIRKILSRWDNQAPVTLTLLLKSEKGVRVLQHPSWWTVRHLSSVLVGLLLLLGVVLAWNVLLKFRVRRKVELLVKERNARREAELEFSTTIRERNRLAANLHDTLPQTFHGISMQLDACSLGLRQLGISPLPALDEAHRMVEYGVNELRRAVWEMRSLSLRGRSFKEALQGILDQTTGSLETHITTHTEGSLEHLPEFVSGNILLIIQEGLRNAQQHGAAKNIRLSIIADSLTGEISIELEDDGAGFEPATALGPEHGHYGIFGMHERAERLNGTFKLKSKPGDGATLLVTVPRTPNEDFSQTNLDNTPG